MTLLITVVCLTVLVSSICSLFEAVLYSTRPAILETASSEGKHKKQARRFLEMKKDVSSPTSAILILNTIANTSGAALSGMLAARVLGDAWVPAFSAVLTVAILFLGEILPKTYGVIHWKSIWHLIVRPLTAMERLLYPAIIVTRKFAAIFTKATSTPGVTEDEIVAMIGMGHRSGELSSAERQLLAAVFEFDEMLTRQIMAPRREVVFFDVDSTLPEALKIAKRTGHTRYPLCRGSLEEIVGLVHIKDLIGVASDESFDWKTVVRPLRPVPETMSISRLLREMQSSHQHMAVVVDEFGTATGIVTFENVLEQIVGTVQDEFDNEMPEVVPEGKNVYLVSGLLPLDRINRDLNLDLYSPDADSLSGLLVSKLDRLLIPGDRVQFNGVHAEVVEVQAGRATRIRLEIRKDPEET